MELSFNETNVIGGSDIPSLFESEIYYQPNNTNFAAIDSFAVDNRDGMLHFFQIKYGGVEPIIGGSRTESYWNTAVVSEGVSVKHCVLVYVVPESQWESSRFLGRNKCRLPGASADFLSACGVCVVSLLQGQSNSAKRDEGRARGCPL